jgi:hypothetical protein
MLLQLQSHHTEEVAQLLSKTKTEMLWIVPAIAACVARPLVIALGVTAAFDATYHEQTVKLPQYRPIMVGTHSTLQLPLCLLLL